MSKFSLTHLSLWEGSPLYPLPKWCPYAVGIGSPPQMAARPQQECWGAPTAQCSSRIVQAHLVLLHFTDTAFLQKKKKKKLKVFGHPASSKFISAIFPTAFVHALSLSHILVIVMIFQAVSLFLHLWWWSVVSDLWCYHCKKIACVCSQSCPNLLRPCAL